jgi:hypothetical protein
MAIYESRYTEFGFYVDGAFHKFNGGRYVTEDEKVIAVLDGITDAVRVDEPAPAKPAPKGKAK